MLAKFKSFFSRPKNRVLPSHDEMIATGWLEKRDAELAAAKLKADLALDNMFKSSKPKASAPRDRLIEGVAAGMAISNLND